MLGNVQIEKNIPPPPKKNGHSGQRVTQKMEVGDSILIEGSQIKRLVAKASAICTAGKRFGDGKFSTRRVEGGIRVWRIE